MKTFALFSLGWGQSLDNSWDNLEVYFLLSKCKTIDFCLMGLSNLHHHNLPISHFKPPPFLIKRCIFKSFPSGISHRLRTRTICGQVILPEAFITAPNSAMAPTWKLTSRVITVRTLPIRILIIWAPSITIKLHLLACSSKLCQILSRVGKNSTLC